MPADFSETFLLKKIGEQNRALLVSVYKGASQKAICEEHLKELSLLSQTFGLEVVQAIPCPVRKFEAATFVTEGKLQELVDQSKLLKVDLVIFDDEITPAQQRNLQNFFQIPVIDRTEVILGVFAQRAQSREARLQIELAQTKYQAPRLKRMWSHLGQQSGTASGGAGGGYLKGEGEKQIEIDRRLLKKRVDQLQNEIDDVRIIRQTQRRAREKGDLPIFAIIGYTNAGKSTLLNALTGAEVFVEDKLFATLDTATRKFTLTNKQEILLIDTVGFIRKLPHLLVAAFKSTLEEALYADILLHLVDVSHPMAEEQARTTFEVLQELNAGEKPIITVLNKIDKCQNQATVDKLRTQYTKTIAISALEGSGLIELQEMMIQEWANQRRTVWLKIPQSDYAVVSRIIQKGQILSQDYEENDILLHVNIPLVLANQISDYFFEKK